MCVCVCVCEGGGCSEGGGGRGKHKVGSLTQISVLFISHRPQCYNVFSCLTQLSMFVLLIDLKLLIIAYSFLLYILSMTISLIINIKMPTIISFLISSSRENFLLTESSMKNVL